MWLYNSVRNAEKPQVRICNHREGFLEKLRVWPTGLLNQTREPLGSLRALSLSNLSRRPKYRRVYLKNIYGHNFCQMAWTTLKSIQGLQSSWEIVSIEILLAWMKGKEMTEKKRRLSDSPSSPGRRRHKTVLLKHRLSWWVRAEPVGGVQATENYSKALDPNQGTPNICQSWISEQLWTSDSFLPFISKSTLGEDSSPSSCT